MDSSCNTEKCTVVYNSMMFAFYYTYVSTSPFFALHRSFSSLDLARLSGFRQHVAVYVCCCIWVCDSVVFVVTGEGGRPRDRGPLQDRGHDLFNTFRPEFVQVFGATPQKASCLLLGIVSVSLVDVG